MKSYAHPQDFYTNGMKIHVASEGVRYDEKYDDDREN